MLQLLALTVCVKWHLYWIYLFKTRQKTQQVEKNCIFPPNPQKYDVPVGYWIWYIQFSCSDLLEIPISITGFSFSELQLLGHRCIHPLISHWQIHSLLRWCVSGSSCLFLGARTSFPGSRTYSRENHEFGRIAPPRFLIMEINIPTQAPHFFRGGNGITKVKLSLLSSSFPQRNHILTFCGWKVFLPPSFFFFKLDLLTFGSGCFV